jgi:large subunit ribosomal protein L13
MIIQRVTHEIDATGRSIGRIATEVALLLRGKGKIGFQFHEDMGDSVVVKNVDKMRVTGRKGYTKLYRTHSGYLGHLREKTLRERMKTEPDKVLFEAISGMLPKNRLTKHWLKRLKIMKGE